MSKWATDILKIARQNPDIIFPPEQPKKDLSKLLPEGSKLEVKFVQLWAALRGPPLVREHKFHETRRFRIDFAHLETKTAIEVEGYGHGRPNRYTSDLEKYNLLTLRGWRLYRVTSATLSANELQRIIDFIKEG